MAAPAPDPARIQAFPSAAEWGAWLAARHAAEPEVWLALPKKGSGLSGPTWEEAVIEALAWGWIDGVKMPGDGAMFLQRFTPRRPGSGWSMKNRRHAEALIAGGRMRAPGLAQVEAARADGRWDRAYAGSVAMAVPAELQAALDVAPEAARAAFAALNRQNRYAFCYRVATAKRPETRAQRAAAFVAMLERGETLY